MIRFIFVILGISLLGSIPVARNIESCGLFKRTNCKPCLRPQPDSNKRVENKPANVTDLDLDKTELQQPTKKEYSREMTVGVKTTAVDPEGDVLTYNYTVSGGRIVGTGVNVFWDLNSVMPGTYTITAGVDDGCGICGDMLTKTVTILESPPVLPCECADISIVEPDTKSGAYDIHFAVRIKGRTPDNLTYNWTISEGTLVTGQGSTSIGIRVAKERPFGQGAVTVEIGGLAKECSCPTTATRSY